MSLRAGGGRLLKVIRGHWRALGALLLGVCLPVVVFAGLAEDVWEGEGFAFDRPVLRWVHGIATPALDSAMVWLSRLGYAWGVVPASLLLFAVLVFRRRYRPATFLATAILGAVVLELAGKLVFQRARPDLWIPLTPERTFSFPSGHATLSSAFAVSLVLLSGHRCAALLVALPFALLVGFSRVYLGVHYPSDVLAGWALSVGWTVGVWHILRSDTGEARTE